MIDWTPELEDAICAAIAITPKGLEHICKDHPQFPKSSAIYEYRAANTGFAEKYTRAKAAQCMVLADQIIEIADESSRDVDMIDIGDGVEVERVNREIVERSKIRIDARKWLAGKLAPKIFGDKLDLNHSGEVAIKRVIADV